MIGSIILFFIKMNNKLCRLCVCEIQELGICKKCTLIIIAICNCCNNIFDVQTHVHGMHDGL